MSNQSETKEFSGSYQTMSEEIPLVKISFSRNNKDRIVKTYSLFVLKLN